MPSQANAKHADTSHAQNRRSPHLYPSRRSQGSTYVGVPPPSSLCLYPLQASWHPLHKMRTAHHSAGTQFLFLKRLWNTVARLPVKGPHTHLSCESTFCPDHRTQRDTERRCHCAALFEKISVEDRKRADTDISIICTCISAHVLEHMCGATGFCTVWETGVQSWSGSKHTGLFNVSCLAEKGEVL